MPYLPTSPEGKKVKKYQTALTAVQKLELSKLDPNTIQREAMGDDLDLEKLVVHLKSKILFDATDRVIDIQVERTIDAASTVKLTLNDYDRTILRSGALNARLDIQIDGLWFRLVKVGRIPGGDNLDLEFEQREIALLRTYPPMDAPHNGVKFANRDNGVTRAQFILNLIREVKEVDIPVVIPRLHQIQEVEKVSDVGFDWGNPSGGAAGTTSGIDTKYNSMTDPNAATIWADPVGAATGKVKRKYLTVKGARATREQINNANTVIATGLTMSANRKVIICAIMTCIVESTLHNYPDGHGTSVGLFQQIDEGWGSYADRHDPATASRMFYDRCIKYEREHPGMQFGDVCQGVQRSGYPERYKEYRWEAQRIVNAYGLPPSVALDGSVNDSEEGSAAANNLMGNMTFGGSEDYLFYRGKAKESGKVWEREDNWSCIVRLAEEVGWRAFFIGGVFYFLTDDELYKTQPMLTITESSQGVQGIGFDYDIGKKGATVDVPALCGLWSAPPGSIVVLQEMGPLDGRWLVNSFSRSMFSSNAAIALSKPQPMLPEPAEDDVEKPPTWAMPQRQVTEAYPPNLLQFQVGMDFGSGTPKQIIDAYVLPLARKHMMVTGVDPAAVAAANAVHGHTVDGNVSDHEGPPERAWAADMSNGSSPTVQMDRLAADIAATFGMSWSGEGVASHTSGSYRYNLLYRTEVGGNHYNHVHFGVKAV